MESTSIIIIIISRFWMVKKDDHLHVVLWLMLIWKGGHEKASTGLIALIISY